MSAVRVRSHTRKRVGKEDKIVKRTRYTIIRRLGVPIKYGKHNFRYLVQYCVSPYHSSPMTKIEQELAPTLKDAKEFSKMIERDAKKNRQQYCKVL